MKIGARAVLLATSLAGVVAPVTVVAGAVLPSHPVTLGWVSTQPRSQAIGIGYCNKEARLYRVDPDVAIPPGCENRGGFKGLVPPPGDAPPPAGDTP